MPPGYQPKSRLALDLTTASWTCYAFNGLQNRRMYRICGNSRLLYIVGHCLYGMQSARKTGDSQDRNLGRPWLRKGLTTTLAGDMRNDRDHGGDGDKR